MKEKIRKLLLALLTVTMLFGITACSSPDEETENVNVEGTSEVEESEEEEVEPIIIYGGVLGDYGSTVTLYDKNGAVADTRYEYSLPAGTYKVTNMSSNMDQLDILEEEVTENEDGDQEQVAVEAILVENGKSTEITLEEGQVVEVDKDSIGWKFELISE